MSRRDKSCVLFKVPTNVNQFSLKTRIEAFMRGPNLVGDVEHTGKPGRLVVNFKDTKVRDSFYAMRNEFRIDQNRIVITRGMHGLGESQLVVDDVLLDLAKRTLMEKPVVSSLLDAQMGPVLDERDRKLPKTIVAEETMGGLIKFANELKRLVFYDRFQNEEEEAAIKSTECEPAPPGSYDGDKDVRMLETTSLASKSPSDVMLDSRTPDGSKSEIPIIPGRIMVEVEWKDILEETADALVIATKPNLAVVDTEMDARLSSKAGPFYLLDCKKEVASFGVLDSTKCLPIKSVPPMDVQCKYIFHVGAIPSVSNVYDTALVSTQYGLAYENALLAASTLAMNTISFQIFNEGGWPLRSGYGAGEVLKKLSKCEATVQLPKLIRFVHMDPYVKQSFEDGFASGFASMVPGPAEEWKSTMPRLVIPVPSEYGKLSTATGTSRIKEQTRDASDAASKAVAQLLETEGQSNETKPTTSRLIPNRPYGKRSKEEKARRAAMTIDEQKKMRSDQASRIVNDLLEHWPDVTTCGFCNEPFASDEPPKTDNESCQRCHTKYHATCLDQIDGCTHCIEQAQRAMNGGKCEEQPPNGRMETKVMTGADKSPPGFPDADGHIEIAYVFSSGLQVGGNPKPGMFHFGCTRIAYLPNNERGRKILDLMKTAFDRGLTMAIVPLDNGYGDYYVGLSSIPHKTSLSGGREKWGYPDESYLSRVENVLKKFGIEDASKPGPLLKI